MVTEIEVGTPRRGYRKSRRAEIEAETRLRITEAAVRLHGTIGPARTTVTAVAEEAGVQRATVYRHFPDEVTLFHACSSHWSALNPAPGPDEWTEIEDPDQRLRLALRELYSWYDGVQPMLDNVLRDAPFVPAMAAPLAAHAKHIEALRAALMLGRRGRGDRRRRVAAGMGLALAFPTWRSLVREQGLGNAAAVELMVTMIRAAGTAAS